MGQDYWIRQTTDKPAYPDLSWSRPERRDQAGKLLIVGGNKHAFNAPAQAFTEAAKAGIGTCRVLLPNSLQRTVGKLFPEAEYGASTPSGSFAKSALADCIDVANWGDGVLLAGDLGHNSETAVLLESFVQKWSGQITLTKDAVDYFLTSAKTILQRPKTTLVVTMAELQKLASGVRFTPAITHGIDLLQLIRLLHDFTLMYPVNIITKHQEAVIVASNGQASTTKTTPNLDPWRIKTAAHAATWLIQHPNHVFETLTTSVVH